ncbi:uncharacterized protein BJX67DRAFT_210585 [Aspergillus lucknowensis]|uniref:Protein kinase domain-containing protein n=1 Tax=Aspergillus lucknowensis TaxID=176173 RepID=A0ABR4M2L3_9EURO
MSSFQTSTFDKPRLFFSTYTGLEDTSAAADINIITFLTLLQKAKIPILPLTWQSSRQLLGRGATSQVNQSLVDIETSFAFKRVAEKDRLEKTDQEIFRRLINEVYMLRHKAVVNHPNILELQGICWDVPLKNKHPAPERAEPGFLDTDKVWPVLVFQKAHFEDLYTFAQRPIGQALGVPERWKICLDIGTAMAHMQSHCMIPRCPCATNTHISVSR